MNILSREKSVFYFHSGFTFQLLMEELKSSTRSIHSHHFAHSGSFLLVLGNCPAFTTSTLLANKFALVKQQWGMRINLGNHACL